MKNTKNITGIRKKLFYFRVELRVFLHFLLELIYGRITAKSFLLFLKRLLYFLSKLQHNKFVKIGKHIRLGLYIPGFPSKAFFTACRKFLTFDEKLPDSTVLVSITSACRFKCEHCYQKKDIGKDVNIESLIEVVKKLQDMGVAFFNIEGGEPFLVYNRLRKICESIDNRSEVWVNSTGDGMTLERLKELKKLNLTAVMFSMHSPYPDQFNAFMGSESAWSTMIKGVDLCHEAGIPVSFNMCLGKSDFYNGVFEKLMETSKELHAAIIQIIKPKPAGGWLESGVDQFSDEDFIHIKSFVNTYNGSKAFRDFPAISAQIIEEDRTMFGCTAGGTDRFYINAKGDLQPCEFLNISFGNIYRDNFVTIYKEMRSHFMQPGEAWLCEKYAKNILQLFNINKLKSLPLDVTLSKNIYADWDRGKQTELYAVIENSLNNKRKLQ